MLNYIWIFGENYGKTANNNSYYLWKKVVGIKDGIEKYLVLENNHENRSKVKMMTEDEKKHILWKDSVKHYEMYREADLLFVTLSYKDVLPEKLYGRKLNLKVDKQLVYLQHGTLGIKKIGYTGHSYRNRMFRFCIYNNSIIDTFKEQNDFKDYQLYYAKYHPRYVELVRQEESQKEKNNILWFVTWREYFGNNTETRIFINYIKKIVNSDKLIQYLKETDTKLRLCVHQFFDESVIKKLEIKETEYIQVIRQDDTDLITEMAKAKLLITDYSSVGFDFTFLNKPVLLYQPDRNTYLKERETYCTLEELKANSISNTKALIEAIVSGDWRINAFFRERLPKNIDYEYIKAGKHILDIYNYFAEIQRNKVTFIGYDFYRIGGTVNATMALAEGLLEEGYMVSLISLLKHRESQELPYGLNINYLFHSNTKSKYNKLKYWIAKNKEYGYLKYDGNKKQLHPYVANQLDNLMKTVKTSTLVSTRESLHFWVNSCTSPYVKNKLCFFHTAVKSYDDFFPGLLEQFKNAKFDKCLFVTSNNMNEVRNAIGNDNIKEAFVIGNSLTQNKMINEEEIEPVEKKDEYYAMFFLRMSKDRAGDIHNLIEFGKYLKANSINNITIDVYGKGNYVEDFIDIIDDEDLVDIINYAGFIPNPTELMKHYDCVVDFTKVQTFGMAYIEAVLNGKKLFCMKTDGSAEILKDIPNTYIESYEGLVDMIENISEVSVEELKENYKHVWKQFSRKRITENFLNALD